MDTWAVQLAEPDGEPDPAQRPATVTVSVCDKHGRPSPDQADRLRRYLEDHQYLSRNPTAAELEALEQARDEGSRLALWRGRRARLVP